MQDGILIMTADQSVHDSADDLERNSDSESKSINIRFRNDVI